jgi:hypothetical protein
VDLLIAELSNPDKLRYMGTLGGCKQPIHTDYSQMMLSPGFHPEFGRLSPKRGEIWLATLAGIVNK